MCSNKHYLVFTFAESGRTDVGNTRNGNCKLPQSRNEFIFTPTSKSAFDSYNLVNDSVLEFDELLIATFDFGPEIENNWNVRKGEPSITYILIRDDDGE